MTEHSRDLQILKKIQSYCDQIEAAHNEYHYDYDVFCSNPTYRNAIALCLLQIGELVRHLSEGFIQAHTNIPWRAIRGMRKGVAHEYGNIDIETLWETAEANIIELRKFCVSQTQSQEVQNTFPDLTMS